MSMHTVEDFAEDAVNLIAASNIDVRLKRNAIAKVYQMEDMLDTSFTRFRNIEQLLECSFAVSFPKKDVPKELEEKMSYDMVRKTGPNDYPTFPHLTYVESGTPLWKGLVAAGKITGIAAEPLQSMTDEEVFMLLYTLGGPLGKPSIGTSTRQDPLMRALVGSTLSTQNRDAGILILIASDSFESFDKEKFEMIFGISKSVVEKELE